MDNDSPVPNKFVPSQEQPWSLSWSESTSVDPFSLKAKDRIQIHRMQINPAITKYRLDEMCVACVAGKEAFVHNLSKETNMPLVLVPKINAWVLRGSAEAAASPNKEP